MGLWRYICRYAEFQMSPCLYSTHLYVFVTISSSLQLLFQGQVSYQNFTWTCIQVELKFFFYERKARVVDFLCFLRQKRAREREK